MRSAMETIVTQKELLFAAEQGYFIEDESVETGPQASEDAKKEILGDVELLSEDQKSSMLALKEPAKYNTMKLKRVSLSFSGASVFFFTPYRADGTPMPASVMKFDSKECVEDEVAKTEKYRGLFGSTTPQVKDLILVDKEGPCSIMQIDLCGGVFGLPEFAKAPPVQTLASILEVELESPSHQVEVIPIINEALERRMFHFTMSARKIKTLSLANTYKLVRFVGHGILNRAKEGAKRGAKNPALAAGFQRPVEIDELDPDGHMIQELCGRKQTVRDLFQKFADMEQSLSEIQRKVVVGLSHNDLHGGNLLVDSQGLVWLIDFATVKEDQHVLMDLTKFLSACTFMYLQDKVNEKHVKSLAKMLSCTPDATTDLPLAFLSDASEDPIAIFFFRIISRLRFCMCVYESGPGSPENDGLPFAIALFSWSARMLSYSEPSLYQKTRALYWSIAGMQRLLWSIGHDVGPTATKWIEENRSLWEGQKGRRLSSSVATDKQAVAAYQFELELPTYLSQAGASEAWSSDILTREKVNVSESCVPLTSKFDGRLNTRSHSLSAKAEQLLNSFKPVFKAFAPALLEQDLFSGRLLIVGDAGSGKSVLTKQIFATLAQDQVKACQALHDLPKVKDDDGRDMMPKLNVAFLPVRVPLVDLSRQLEETPEDEISLEADVISDLLNTFVAKKYGQDSNLLMLVQDMRNAAMPDFEDEEVAFGLVLLLDGLDEASSRRLMVLDYIKSLLAHEQNHFPILTSRPGVLASVENERLGSEGYISVSLTRLATEDALTLASRTLERLGESKDFQKKICNILGNPGYASLTGNPLCLNLLTHVLRKAQKDPGVASSSSTTLLTKSEIYQKAFKLMLHQSDAAKFMSRDGQSDTEMIKHLEALKSSAARKLYQQISWQGQCSRKRVFTLEECAKIGSDEKLMASFSHCLKESRLPVFQQVDSGKGPQQYQLSHLSFQEVLAAEFVAGVMRYSSTANQVRPYLSFLTSDTLQALGRERLAEPWWLATWIAVGDLLEEEDFSKWCSVLAEDERCKLKPGALCFQKGCELAKVKLVHLTLPRHLSAEEVELRRLGTFFEVVWVDLEACKVQLKPHCHNWMEEKLMKKFSVDNDVFFSGKPLDSTIISWRADGVNCLAAEAARIGCWSLAQGLSAHGVLLCARNNQQKNVYTNALLNSDWQLCRWLAARQVQLFPGITGGDDGDICILGHRWHHEEARNVQRPFPSCMQLAALKPKLTGVLREAFEGTLQFRGDELDVNFSDIRSGVSLLMLAAAGSHPKLVGELLQKRAWVNSRSCEGCTALSFALDCTGNDETANRCVQILLEAKADVTVKTGATYDGSFMCEWFGKGIPLGSCPIFAKHEKKLELLCNAGYDMTARSDHGLNAMFFAGFFVDEDEVASRLVAKVKEYGLKFTDDMTDYRDPHRNIQKIPWHSSHPPLLLDQRWRLVPLYSSKQVLQMQIEQGCSWKSCADKAVPKGTIFPWFIQAMMHHPSTMIGDAFMWHVWMDIGLEPSYGFTPMAMLGTPTAIFWCCIMGAQWNTSMWFEIFNSYAKWYETPLNDTKPKWFKECMTVVGLLPALTTVFNNARTDWLQGRMDQYQRQLAEQKKR